MLSCNWDISYNLQKNRHEMHVHVMAQKRFVEGQGGSSFQNSLVYLVFDFTFDATSFKGTVCHVLTDVIEGDFDPHNFIIASSGQNRMDWSSQLYTKRLPPLYLEGPYCMIQQNQAL